MAVVSHVSTAKLGKLIKDADPSGRFAVIILSKNRLGVGKDPSNPTLAIDLSRETVVPFKPEGEQARPAPIFAPSTGRKTGTYWLEIKGRRIETTSKKELLLVGLRELEKLQPGTLEKLTLIRPRSKRIVALDRNMLFVEKRLAEKHSEELIPGWWVGTNNSGPETGQWLYRAGECAGLKAAEFKIGPL